MGDYDECKDIEREGHPAHYCTLNMEMKVGKSLPVTAGFCLPAACNVLSIRPIVNFLLEKTGNDFAQVKQIHCQRNETDWWNKVLFIFKKMSACLVLSNSHTSFDCIAFDWRNLHG